MNLQRIILESLDLVHPRMLAERVLVGDVRMHEPTASRADILAAVRALEEKEQVVVIGGEDTNRIKITAAGKARLAE